MENKLAICGDVHGKQQQYVKLIKDYEYSLQVGDMGFSYSCLEENLDYNKHKFIGGNHDNYDKVIENGNNIYTKQPPHALGDFGIWSIRGFEEIFYCRGADSIDKDRRILGVDWWEDEELDYKRSLQAIDFYTQVKPNFVVTHCAPLQILSSIPFNRYGNGDIQKTKSVILLDQLYNIHQPKIWIFGHYHVNWEKDFSHLSTNKLTKFICLAELSIREFVLDV